LHRYLGKENGMNKIIMKTLVTVITLSVLTAGMTVLSSCNSDKKVQKDPLILGTDGTDLYGNPVAALKALPSVAKGTMTIGGEEVSAFEFDFNYYSIYLNISAYLSYGYLPTNAADGSFDLTAICGLEGYETATWEEYLMEETEKQIQDSYIFEDYALAAGMTLTQEDQDLVTSYYDQIQTQADTYSLSFDDFLKTMYGVNASKELLDPIMTRLILFNNYLMEIREGYTFTDAELEAYYTANQASYQNIDVPTVRHILFKATVGVSGAVDATQEELAAAEALANAALAKITTYEDMVTVGDAALADGSAAESAEYSFNPGEMVAPFEEWSYDSLRMPGDTGVVQTEFGFHVMFFVSEQKDWMVDAKNSLSEEKLMAFLKEQEALPQYQLITVE
jgi:hypothetical protein